MLRAEPLVYLTKIIQGLVDCCVLEAEPLVNLTKIIQGMVVCYVLWAEPLVYPDQDFPRADGPLCTVSWMQSPWCI